MYPCSLISAFVVHCLDSILPVLAISQISRLKLASVSEQAGLSLTLSKTTKTGFLMMRLIFSSLSEFPSGPYTGMVYADNVDVQDYHSLCCLQM